MPDLVIDLYPDGRYQLTMDGRTWTPALLENPPKGLVVHEVCAQALPAAPHRRVLDQKGSYAYGSGSAEVTVVVPADYATPSVNPGPCRHPSTKWEPKSRFLVCGDCGAELPPGTCKECGRPAGGTAFDGTKFAADGFQCAGCYNGRRGRSRETGALDGS